eukprot:6925444-Pyramimonas_sp.AAC.1
MRKTFLEVPTLLRRRSFGSPPSARETAQPAGPRQSPSAGQAKEWTLIAANVGGQIGLDAYL